MVVRLNTKEYDREVSFLIIRLEIRQEGNKARGAVLPGRELPAGRQAAEVLGRGGARAWRRRSPLQGWPRPHRHPHLFLRNKELQNPGHGHDSMEQNMQAGVGAGTAAALPGRQGGHANGDAQHARDHRRRLDQKIQGEETIP